MRAGIFLSLFLGLGVMIALIVSEGAATIGGLLSQAGWVLLLLIPLQSLPLLLYAVSWRALIVGRARLPVLFMIACVRQAINRLLPVANVGGEIAGIRILVRQGMDGATAAASIIVELMLSLVSQYLFLALGVMLLVSRIEDAHVIRVLMLGLAACFPVLALMVIILRHGKIFMRIERLAARFFSRWLNDQRGFDHGTRLEAGIEKIFAVRTRPVRAIAWNFAGLIVGCSETWFALRWLGHPVSIVEAVVLESLTQAAKSLLFMVPAGLGVQEAGLIATGHWLGIGPDVALALSLAKRMRELLLGVPVLVAWQLHEGRHLAPRVRNPGGG